MGQEKCLNPWAKLNLQSQFQCNLQISFVFNIIQCQVFEHQTFWGSFEQKRQSQHWEIRDMVFEGNVWGNTCKLC